VERAREYLKTVTVFRITSNVVGQQRVIDGTALDTSRKKNFSRPFDFENAHDPRYSLL